MLIFDKCCECSAADVGLLYAQARNRWQQHAEQGEGIAGGAYLKLFVVSLGVSERDWRGIVSAHTAGMMNSDA